MIVQSKHVEVVKTRDRGRGEVKNMHYKLFVVGWVVFEEKMSDHQQCIFSGSIIREQTKYLCTSEKQTVLPTK